MIQELINLNRYFATNNINIASFRFARVAEQSLSDDSLSNEYVQMHLHQPLLVSHTIQDTPAQRFTINLALHDVMSFDSSYSERETNIANLHNIAAQYVAYLRRFDRLNKERSIETNITELTLVSDVSVSVESYVRDDVTLMCLISCTVEIRNTIDYCDIEWI